MTAEQPNWWVRFWVGPEPTSDPRRILRRVFRKMGLIAGLVLGASSVPMMWVADAPLWLKVVIPPGVFVFMFGVTFSIGLLIGRFLLFAVGDKQGS